MNYKVRIRCEATAELEATIPWYDDREPGLGGEFYAEVKATIGKIQEQPELGSPIPHVADELPVRRRLVRRFPFSLAYLVVDDVIEVLAVAHGRQKPGYWRGRL